MVLTGFLLAYLAFFLLTCRAKDSGDEWGPQWLSRGLEVAMRYAEPHVHCSQSLVCVLLAPPPPPPTALLCPGPHAPSHRMPSFRLCRLMLKPFGLSSKVTLTLTLTLTIPIPSPSPSASPSACRARCDSKP